MAQPDYDDPAVEERWCEEQRAEVARYLREQKAAPGAIGEWPAWHVPPIVAIWAIESLKSPGWIGWWAISGDLPTDYISSADVEPPQHPRKALRVFAERWMDVSQAWKEGREHQDMWIEGSTPREDLAKLLEARARLFLDLAADDSVWEDE